MCSEKKIIGIIPSAALFETTDPYLDQYRFINHYGKRIQECGAIPMGMLPIDGHFSEEQLALCDGFVICGGRKIFPYHFEVVDFAMAHEKKLLGICLGMQTIGSWFRVKEEANKRGFQGRLSELYDQMKKERFMFTLPVEHHWDVTPHREHLSEAKHPVAVTEGTYLHELLGCSVVQGLSLHHYRLNGTAKELMVSAVTEDGTVEGIEYGRYILGVQFHPEADRELEMLFRRFFDLEQSI